MNKNNKLNFLIKSSIFDIDDIEEILILLANSINNSKFNVKVIQKVYNSKIGYSDYEEYELLLREDSSLNNYVLYNDSNFIKKLIKEEEKDGKVIVLRYPHEYGDKIHFLNINADNSFNWHINLEYIPYFKSFIEFIIKYRFNNRGKKLDNTEIANLLINNITDIKINNDNSNIKSL